MDYSKILSEPPSNFLRHLQNKERTTLARDFWELSSTLKELFGRDGQWAKNFVVKLKSVPKGFDWIWRSTFDALSGEIKSEEDWEWFLGVIEPWPNEP